VKIVAAPLKLEAMEAAPARIFAIEDEYGRRLR
jgi:kynurenine formamidase